MASQVTFNGAPQSYSTKLNHIPNRLKWTSIAKKNPLLFPIRVCERRYKARFNEEKNNKQFIPATNSHRIPVQLFPLRHRVFNKIMLRVYNTRPKKGVIATNLASDQVIVYLYPYTINLSQPDGSNTSSFTDTAAN